MEATVGICLMLPGGDGYYYVALEVTEIFIIHLTMESRTGHAVCHIF